MRGYVDTRWGQVHYEATGRGDTSFVLFHETPLEHGAFRRLAPVLATKGRVFAFDTPGYGESDGPPATTTMEEYARTLATALAELEIADAVLYGVHTGASVAFELAARAAPERVRALALSGMPFYSDEVRAARVVRTIPPAVADGSHLVDTFAWEPDSYDAELRSRLVTGVALAPERGYDAFHAVYAYEPALVADAIRCPTLLISHLLDPLFEADQRALSRLPNASQVIVDADRLPLYWTVPDRVGAELIALASSSAEPRA